MKKTVEKSEIGKSRVYSPYYKELGREDVVLWDVMPLGPYRRLQVIFESKRSHNRQGLWLRTDSVVTVNGQTAPSMTLWYPKTFLWFKSSPMVVDCVVDSKDGLLSVYNIWEDPFKQKASQASSSGMLIEEISPEERRYRCHDVGPDPDFCRLVFRIKLLSSPSQ